MALEPQCVVCAHPLQNPKRADRRYCGSSCRVRAFRVRKKRQLPTSTAISNTRRAERESSGSLLDGTRTQLALFRELRQARKHAAELTAQLTQAYQAAEQQRHEHDQERQALQDSLAAARQQRARLEATLLETQTLAATQLQADTQTAERLTTEKRQATERIGELEGEASTAAAAHQKAVQQLQDEQQAAQRQLQTAEDARMAAEERVQLLDTVLKELVEEKDRSAKLHDKLEQLTSSTQAERAQHERALREAREQTATEREQADTLRLSLREAKATLRQQRDQLDRTALFLTAARAAIDLRVNQAQLAKMKEELQAAQKDLATRTEERDLAHKVAKELLNLHEKQNQKLTALEDELSKQKTLAAEHQTVLAEVTGKMNKLYDQLILIKTKKDWRL
jgi:chromosome segregation ATPase